VPEVARSYIPQISRLFENNTVFISVIKFVNQQISNIRPQGT